MNRSNVRRGEMDPFGCFGVVKRGYADAYQQEFMVYDEQGFRIGTPVVFENGQVSAREAAVNEWMPALNEMVRQGLVETRGGLMYYLTTVQEEKKRRLEAEAQKTLLSLRAKNAEREWAGFDPHLIERISIFLRSLIPSPTVKEMEEKGQALQRAMDAAGVYVEKPLWEDSP